MVKNISSLPKDIRAYYHIKNDIVNFIKDNEDLIETMTNDNFPEPEVNLVKGENEGLKIALNLVDRAIKDLELRINK